MRHVEDMTHKQLLEVHGRMTANLKKAEQNNQHPTEQFFSHLREIECSIKVIEKHKPIMEEAYSKLLKIQ